jgi:A/G-specific adenine glycosylase
MQNLELLRSELLCWFNHNQRDLPWRRTRDPYAIWLSEIMLQQTRVAAVIPYFQRFLARFPTVESLAEAGEADLLAHWAGLGYYYRARNLQRAAQAIVQAGRFPASHEALLELPGVGDYTAAAIASIAFNLPHAVLDGNVFRVLSRVFADRTNIASPAGKKHFAMLADKVLDRENPAAFNQAMMELGATVCLPKSPQCLLCPIAFCCAAREQNQTAELPVKIVDRKSHKIERTLYWIERGNEVLAWQRPQDSRLMPGFWELPEHDQLPVAVAGAALGEFKHGITIYDYRFQIVSAAVPDEAGVCQWLSAEQLAELPLSTIFSKAMRVVRNQNKKVRVQVTGSR